MTEQPELQPEECCQDESISEPSETEAPHSHSIVNQNTNSVNVKMTEVIGASFLGIICLILLVLYARAQRRNRRLTAELAKRAPRLVLLQRPTRKKAAHG